MANLKYLLISLFLGCTFTAGAQNPVAKYELIDNPDFPMTDIGVAVVNVKDYGIDCTGTTDCTATVQKLIDFLADDNQAGGKYARSDYRNRAGGVIYFPAGTYMFSGCLQLPVGVTIRGDWRKPEPGQPLAGTVFKIKGGRGTGQGTVTEGSAFITMYPSTLVEGIAFWYADNNNMGSVRKYPPTILYGSNNHWGNDYCNVRHCTFVNSYIAIQFNSQNGGGCPNIFDIYGTPLYHGVVMDCIADVGRFDGISFSPAYWAESGLPDAPSETEIAAYTRANATGIVMRRNDWSYTCNYRCDSYNVGFLGESSPETANTRGNPNGHNYGFELSNCQAGVRLTGAGGSGIMFTRVNTSGCDIGFEVTGGVEGPALLYECRLQASGYAVSTTSDAGSPLLMTDCTVEGKANILGGELNSTNSTYSSDVFISPKARTIFTGNTVNGTFDNRSIFECKVDDSPVTLKRLPEYRQEWMDIKTTHPAKNLLFVATEYGAVPVSYDDFGSGTGVKDNTSAIQAALDAAKTAGGGIVYLPAGRYRMDGNLTIPSGVELKGAGDIASTPRSHGAILEVYAGEGDENGLPFITMAEGSGMRGISVDYPWQDNPTAVKKYPYTVRANKDVYIVNLGLRAAYRGVDLFTNKCDNHYVDYLSGHCFMNVVRVGGGSEHGTISNIQVNTNCYACGDETKWGKWHNSLDMADASGKKYDQEAYYQNKRSLDFLIVGDCSDQVLYNNFLFGCNKGLVFQDDGRGGAKVYSLGNAVDGAVNTVVIDGIAEDLDLVNSQIVALNLTVSGKLELPAYFIKMGPQTAGRTVTLFSSNIWGSGEYSAYVQGGRLDYNMTNFYASGKIYTFRVDEEAELNVNTGYIVNVNALSNSKSEPGMSIRSSFIDAKGATVDDMRVWENNLSHTWAFTDLTAVQDRTGWKATAFNDQKGTGIARNAIDGKIASRWDSQRTQQAGDWFALDFGGQRTFNAVLLDDSNSPTDQPATYTLQIWQNGDWQPVCEGKGGGSFMIIQLDEPVTTDKIRIVENTNKSSGYWSIHEIYIANLDMNFTGIDDVFIDRNSETESVKVYNMSGVFIGNDMTSLQRGIYIVHVERGGCPAEIRKIIIR